MIISRCTACFSSFFFFSFFYSLVSLVSSLFLLFCSSGKSKETERRERGERERRREYIRTSGKSWRCDTRVVASGKLHALIVDIAIDIYFVYFQRHPLLRVKKETWSTRSIALSLLQSTFPPGNAIGYLLLLLYTGAFDYRDGGGGGRYRYRSKLSVLFFTLLALENIYILILYIIYNSATNIRSLSLSLVLLGYTESTLKYI